MVPTSTGLSTKHYETENSQHKKEHREVFGTRDEGCYGPILTTEEKKWNKTTFWTILMACSGG